MKKYILFMVSAIVFAFTSCTSSDDIEINDIQSKYQAVFKINPSTVVEPFTWQPTAGELSTIPTGNKLRIRTLIYNNIGELVYEKTDQFNNYDVIMNFSTELEKGDYTIVAISDVIEPADNDVPEYWKLSDYTHLNETKLTQTGYIGYQCEILGVSSQNISVSSTNNEYMINIKPAGAVVYTFYDNIHQYSDIKRYQLNITQVVETAVFDSNGNLVGSLENNNNEYDWRMNIIYPDNVDADGGYIINYVLPQKNLRLRYKGCTYTGFEGDTDGDSYWFGEAMHIPSINAGDEFYVWIDVADMENGYSVECGNVTGLTYPNLSSTRASVNQIENKEYNVLYIKDLK